MQKRDRIGQLQLSFGMIFSIIIIIATVGVTTYFILKIMNTSECTKIQLFKTDLQDNIDKLWRSPFGQEVFTSNLPSGIKKVCIGMPSLTASPYAKIVSELDIYIDEGENLFFYPPKEACNGDFVSTKLNHIKDNFNCFDVIKGKISFKINKMNSTDPLVSIKK